MEFIEEPKEGVTIIGERGGEQPMFAGSGALMSILRLAVPTVIALFLHSALLAEEAALLGKVSATKLAGAALVFPWLTLLGMMAAGGLGGGVASAISRSLGAGRRNEVIELIVHAVLLGGLVGAVMSCGLAIYGHAIFAWQGGVGEVETTATAYGVITLAAGTFMWTANILASIFRGLGNTYIPSKWNAIVSLVIACLIPVAVLGCGPIPAGGVVGAAVIMAIYYFTLTLVFFWQLLRHEVGRAGQKRPVRFSWRHIGEILHVGGPSAFNTFLSVGTQLLATAVATRIGESALAAYGAITRIEGLLFPFVFGIGSALVPLVGMNVGAGNWSQVRRLAWTGAGLGFGVAGLVGLLMWIFPAATMRFFTDDAHAISAGVHYLHWSAWAYGFWGLGVGMTFSCQGARRPITSLVASTARCVYVGLGGWWLMRSPGHGTGALGLVMGSSAIAFGISAVLLGGPLLPDKMRWKRKAAPDVT
ncbi:MAG TPA: MATE family efflux transporter [Opitutales bacterium]|jgi:putative MATE family efflux protein|nr:MATE family efflux transporter [Opitutales bacterium]